MNILELAILKKMVGGGGGSGTDNYNDLSNLPQINGETLAGNKTAQNLGLQDALIFDSAPTEDSTNPVESGGVYNALAGKQDNLTFDDDPTENSTNPVKSGGVYSALAGKQDNLTFDGVYNASTNKAATESTVTNAIAGLDVSAFSVDADETISSISETDGKINVTKQDIAIASNQVTAMTGYTKPSSAPATPAIQTSDTANQAFGKLEFKADTNQTNILSTQESTIGENLIPYPYEKASPYTHNGVTFTYDANGIITLNRPTTGTAAAYMAIANSMPINSDDIGEDFTMSLSDVSNLAVHIYIKDSSNAVVRDLSVTSKLTFSFQSGEVMYSIGLWTNTSATFDNVKLSIMLEKGSVAHPYQPYKLSRENLYNESYQTALYSLQTGVKNLFNPEASGNWQYGLSSYSADANTGTISIATTASDWARTSAPITLPAGEYKFCGNVTALVGNAVITGNTSSSGMETAIFNNIELSTTGTFEISFTLNTETPFWIAVYTNYSSSIVSNSVTITGMMICTKAAWDQEPNVFRPYALSNADLTQLEQQDRNALVEAVDKGAKNLLKINKADSVNAPCFTSDLMNTVTIDGTIGSGSSAYFFNLNYIDGNTNALPAGDYIISSPDDMTNLRFAFYETVGGTSTRYVSPSLGDNMFEFTVSPTATSNRCRIETIEGKVFNNRSVRIMICTKAEWDVSHEYEPHALPNSDLTQLEAEDRAALAEVVDSGAKNLIPAQFVTSTYNGASFVWGENGSFTASRVSEGVYTTYNILKNFELPVGDYVLSIGSALIENYEVRLILSDSSVKILNSTTDTYVDFTITKGLSINYLYVSVGTNATSSVTIYPMICSKADWDISSKYKPYVPYDVRKAVETNSTVNNDLNNCIDTSVVYRCVNGSNLPANCPNFKFNNVSSFEMTCTTPTANIILQELKPNSIATLPRIYYRRRTGVGSEQSPYVWSKWETMNCIYPVISGINYNDCDETGFYEVMATVTSNTQNSPNGNNTSNNFFVIVQRRDAVYIKQIACDVRTTDVYTRNCIDGTWSDWVKLATASDIAALEARIQALENA